MKSVSWLGYVLLPVLALSAVTGCTPFDKRVTLTYEQVAVTRGGTGEVRVLSTVFAHPLERVPAGSVLGTVKQTATQIVATDSVSDWVRDALVQELRAAGYTVTSVPEQSPGEGKSVQMRVERLTVNQETDALVMTTSADIGLEANAWRNGSLVRTLTVSAGAKDQGLDRSGVAVADTLRRTLRSAMGEIMPGLVNALER